MNDVSQRTGLVENKNSKMVEANFSLKKNFLSESGENLVSKFATGITLFASYTISSTCLWIENTISRHLQVIESQFSEDFKDKTGQLNCCCGITNTVLFRQSYNWHLTTFYFYMFTVNNYWQSQAVGWVGQAACWKFETDDELKLKLPIANHFFYNLIPGYNKLFVL